MASELFLNFSALSLEDNPSSTSSSASNSVIFSDDETQSVCTAATSTAPPSEADDAEDHIEEHSNASDDLSDALAALPLSYEPLGPLDDRIAQVLDTPVGLLMDQLSVDFETVTFTTPTLTDGELDEVLIRPKSNPSKDLELGRTTYREGDEADRAASTDPEMPFIVGTEGEERPIRAIARSDIARLKIRLNHTEPSEKAFEARFDPYGGAEARERILQSIRVKETANDRRDEESDDVIDTETSWRLGLVRVWVRPRADLSQWRTSEVEVTLVIQAKTTLESFQQYQQRQGAESSV